MTSTGLLSSETNQTKIQSENISSNNDKIISNIIGTPHHNEAHIENPNGSSIKYAVWNQVNSIIGAGIIGLPNVYKISGLFGGIILMIIFVFTTIYTLKMLIKTAKIVKQYNYEDLCHYCFGLKGYYIVSISMLLFDFGATITYIIILGDSGEKLLNIFGYDDDIYRTLFILILSIVIILPLSLPKDISKLEKFSALSVFTVIIMGISIFIIWFDWRVLYKKSDKYDSFWPDNITYFDIYGIPTALGIIAFSFVCHDNSFLIYKTLKNPTNKRWGILCFFGINISLFISLLLSLPGYFTFGNDVESDILNNYSDKNKLIIVIRIIYCISICLTFPVSYFVVRHVLYGILNHGPQYTSILDVNLKTHLIYTLPSFFVILLMGVLIRNLGIVMSLSGNLAAVILAYVLPPLCYLKVSSFNVKFWNEPTKDKKWDSFINIIGPILTFIMGISIAIFASLYTILDAFNVI